MELLHTITHSSCLHDIRFCKRVEGDGELLLAGAEDKKLSVYDVPKDRTKPPNVIAEMVGHTNRYAFPSPVLDILVDTSTTA